MNDNIALTSGIDQRLHDNFYHFCVEHLEVFRRSHLYDRVLIERYVVDFTRILVVLCLDTDGSELGIAKKADNESHPFVFKLLNVFKYITIVFLPVSAHVNPFTWTLRHTQPAHLYDCS